MEKDWFLQVIDEGLAAYEEEKKLPGFFTLQAVDAVPFIQFPGFSEKECREVQIQTQNVMRTSLILNKYGEVAITYSRGDNFKEKKYCTVLGDYSSVPIMEDKATASLINFANKANDVVIISIHNHPNNSLFSLNDLLIFSENSSIKLMEIVNGKGEVSYLFRPHAIDLHNSVAKMIVNTVPDFVERKSNWLKTHTDGVFNFSDLLQYKERQQIVKNTLIYFEKHDVLYSPYIDQIQADLLLESFNNQEHSSIQKFDQDARTFDLYGTDFKYEYKENGEDGGEWEYDCE